MSDRVQFAVHVSRTGAHLVPHSIVTKLHLFTISNPQRISMPSYYQLCIL
jgi:hypothetical protein